MSIYPAPRLEGRRVKRMAVYFAASVLIMALLVLSGWQWDIDVLRRPIPGLAAMNPLTAVAFILVALAFFGLPGHTRRPFIQVCSHLFAIGLLLIGSLKLSGLFFPFLDNIDLLLYTHRMEADLRNMLSCRMAPNTAFVLILSGLALLLLLQKLRHGYVLIQWLAVAIGCISLLSIIGYLYRVKELYGYLRYVPMSILTAACFFLFSLAILFTMPDRGIMKDLTSSLTGSITARRLLPIAFLAPIVLGGIRLYGTWKAGLSVELGVTALVLSIIICFVCIIWYNAVLLNKRDIRQRRMEEELLAIENRFELLVSSIKDYAIILTDTEGKIISWNEGARSIKGYSAEEIIGRHISVFYTPEEIDRGEPAHNLEMAGKYGHHYSSGWRVRKDGSRFWADIVFTAIYNADYQLQGFAKITKDITEAKLAQERIAYQARLIEESTDAIFSTDISFAVMSWNKAAEDLYGYTAKEMLGRSALDLNRDPRGEELRAQRRAELLEKGFWKGEVVHLRKTGQPLTILISASAIRNPAGEPEGYVIACRDITERKIAEDLLHRSNETLAGQVRDKTAQLAGVFEQLSEGFMAIDKLGQITYANRRAAEMYKLNNEDLVGHDCWREFPPAMIREFGENFHHSVSGQENRHFEMFVPPLRLWLDCSMYPSPEGVSFFFRDVTEQRNDKERIRQSNSELRALASHLQDVREEERSDIARKIHDELGQQLTGLKMDLSWIAKKMVADENDHARQKIKETLDLTDNAIRTVRKIATDLRPGILDDLGLVAAIEWQSQEFEKRSGIATSFRSGMTELNCSSPMSIGLFRICQEALTNVARHSLASNVGITLDQERGKLILRIADNGKGMALQTAGPKKTLGLLGMKERAMMMGGQLEIESQVGKGLTLTITVPSEPQNGS